MDGPHGPQMHGLCEATGEARHRAVRAARRRNFCRPPVAHTHGWLPLLIVVVSVIRVKLVLTWGAKAHVKKQR